MKTVSGCRRWLIQQFPSTKGGKPNKNLQKKKWWNLFWRSDLGWAGKWNDLAWVSVHDKINGKPTCHAKMLIEHAMPKCQANMPCQSAKLTCHASMSNQVNLTQWGRHSYCHPKHFWLYLSCSWPSTELILTMGENLEKFDYQSYLEIIGCERLCLSCGMVFVKKWLPRYRGLSWKAWHDKACWHDNMKRKLKETVDMSSAIMIDLLKDGMLLK